MSKGRNTIVVGTRISDTLYDLALDAAANLRISMSDLIGRALIEYLNLPDDFAQEKTEH